MLFRSERLDRATIAGANQDRAPAVNVSFVAPLPKCHLLNALGHAPSFANFTNGGFVSGGHCPIPSASPKPGQSARYVLRGCVSYLTPREGFEIDRLTKCVLPSRFMPCLAILFASIRRSRACQQWPLAVLQDAAHELYSPVEHTPRASAGTIATRPIKNDPAISRRTNLVMPALLRSGRLCGPYHVTVIWPPLTANIA